MEENPSPTSPTSIPPVPPPDHKHFFILGSLFTLLMLLFVAILLYFGNNSSQVHMQTMPTAEELGSKTATVIDEFISDLVILKQVEDPVIQEEDISRDVYLIAHSRDAENKSCGGKYDVGPCYFFVKSGSPILWPLVIWTWRGAGTSMKIDSIKFINSRTLQFDSQFADGGLVIVEVWQFDVQVGSSTLISSKEN